MENRITEFRKARGWSQQDLAERLGVTHQVISKWEHGLGEPQLPLALELAEVLGTTIEELYPKPRR